MSTFGGSTIIMFVVPVPIWERWKVASEDWSTSSVWLQYVHGDFEHEEESPIQCGGIRLVPHHLHMISNDSGAGTGG